MSYVCDDCKGDDFSYSNAEITCRSCGLVKFDRIPTEDDHYVYEFTSVMFEKHCASRENIELIQITFNLPDWQVEDLNKMYDAYKQKVQRDHNQLYVLVGLLYYLTDKVLSFEQLCIPCSLDLKKFSEILSMIRSSLITNKDYKSMFIGIEDVKIVVPIGQLLNTLPYYSEIEKDLNKIKKLIYNVTDRLNSSVKCKKIADSFKHSVIHVGILYICLKMMKKQLCKVGTFAESFNIPIGNLFKIESALKEILI